MAVAILSEILVLAQGKPHRDRKAQVHHRRTGDSLSHLNVFLRHRDLFGRRIRTRRRRRESSWLSHGECHNDVDQRDPDKRQKEQVRAVAHVLAHNLRNRTCFVPDGRSQRSDIVNRSNEDATDDDPNGRRQPPKQQAG